MFIGFSFMHALQEDGSCHSPHKACQHIRPEVEWKSAKSKRYRTFISFKLQTVLDHLHFTILFGQCCRVYYICTFKNDYIFYIYIHMFLYYYIHRLHMDVNGIETVSHFC